MVDCQWEEYTLATKLVLVAGGRYGQKCVQHEKVVHFFGGTRKNPENALRTAEKKEGAHVSPS